MMNRNIARGLSLMLVTIATLSMSVIAITGCKPKGATSTVKDSKVDQSVGGWWCVEHGVPEEECALCDKSLVAKFKVKGDWCKEHDRPESTCFLCRPARFDKFAARYEAKTGMKPPKPTE